ncbi:GAL3ST1 [Bugula neritina]|uniref:GAL3ST1 n=1 Tax=Bugula neritina TaxID=10212 RepID=A0A7J7JMK5_BUGNE|nr:GAL3ST1 [Bugula neritina]
MKRKFCWDHGDIFYKSMEVYSKSHHLTPAEEEKLLSPDMNLGDKLLYEAFNNSWWKQPEVKDPDFWEEVKHFQRINQLQAEKCRVALRSGKKTYSYTIEASKWSPAIQLTYDRCDLLTMNKYPLMKKLSQYALGYKYYIYQVYHYLTARVSNLF